MIGLNAFFSSGEGIIIEPVISEKIGFIEYLFTGQATNANPGFIIALAFLVVSLIAAVGARDWAPLIALGSIAAIISIIAIAVSIAQFVGEENDKDYNAKLIAEQLSEHYSLKITEKEVSDSGLIEKLRTGDSISQVEYSSNLNRDAETGEWAKSINYFIIDGKVVEIYSEAEPLKGEFKTAK